MTKYPRISIRITHNNHEIVQMRAKMFGVAISKDATGKTVYLYARTLDEAKSIVDGLGK